MMRHLQKAAGAEAHGQRPVRFVGQALGRMEQECADVRRGRGGEAQHDLFRRLLEHAEGPLSVSLQVEVGRRHARLVEGFHVIDRVESEQHRLVAMRGTGDKVGARTEQEPVRNNLSPSRRIAVVEHDLDAGQQRLAQLSKNGGVGERARPDRAGERLCAKLRLDIDGETPPVRLAQARADFLAQRAQARGAAGGARRLQSAGGVFEFGQFLGGRRRGEIAEAARREPEPDFSPVLDPVERPERRLDRVAHPLGATT